MLTDLLLKEGYLEPLDLHFATLHSPQTESLKAFLAALMHSAREGHLCLDLKDMPLPAHEHRQKWEQLVLEGSKQIITSPYIVRHDHFVYLEKNYRYETDVRNELNRLRGLLPLPHMATQLQGEQLLAFELVRKHQISIIEGGPGTGKTYLTAELVKSFGKEAKIILTAPTGKAASRLKENNPSQISQTLHALLGVRASLNLFKQKSFIEADLIVVDEASMLDAKMMRFLLKSLPSHQRLVFLGDGNQLPPVEIGSLFCELIDLIPTVHLTVCYRSDRQEVLETAQQVLSQKTPQIHGPLSWDNLLHFIKLYQDQGVILTPLRQGEWGVEMLNQRIHQFISSENRGQRRIPIMITRNDPMTGLSNGDMGVLKMHNDDIIEAEFILGQEVKQFPLSKLPSYELAYVLSVHKSQGSEFPHVLCLVPPGSERFGKEMLYTAVTRAKESVYILGDETIIEKTILTSSYKKSGLKNRWEEG